MMRVALNASPRRRRGAGLALHARAASVWGLAVLASSGAGATVLSWQAVLEASTRSHPVVLARQAAWRAAAAEAEGVAWRRYPTPSVELTGGSGDTQQIWRLEQPLWNGGRTDAAVSAAEWRAVAAQAALHEARRDLLMRAAAALSEHARLQHRLSQAELTLAEFDRRLAQMSRRVEQQTHPASDELVVQTRQQAARGDVLQTQQALQQALAELTGLAGQPVTHVAPALPPQPPASGAPETAEATQAQALQHAPALARLRAEWQAAQADATERRAARWPQLALRLDRVAPQGAAQAQHRAQLVLTFTPGAGLGLQSAAQAAAARVEAARAAHESATRDVTQQVQQALNERHAAGQRLLNARALHVSAAKVSESFARLHDNGRKSWLDMLNAIREEGQARLAEVDARHQLQLAHWRLQVLLGLPVSTTP